MQLRFVLRLENWRALSGTESKEDKGAGSEEDGKVRKNPQPWPNRS